MASQLASAVQTESAVPARVTRRITASLFTAQSLVSAAFVASGTVSVIAAAELSGNAAWAGVPASVMQLTAAFAALGVAAATDRIGRRWGLALGLALGALGTGLAVAAILTGGFLLFLGGSVLVGVAAAAMKLGRYAAAEVHPSHSRGRAISHVVIGGAVGSVVGPLLIGPSGNWALETGIHELAGPYLVSLAGLALASMVIFFWLRPDPRDLGRAIARLHLETTGNQGPARPLSQVLRTPGALVAVSAMVFSQTAMVLIMGVTSLHMRDHQHALAGISVVISVHAFGMYAFSLVSGRLTDRWGRGPVILAGSALLVLACALATLSPEILPLSIALFLLGVGWNLCYVAGSALLSDQLSPQERTKAQGAGDFMTGMATSAALLGSGLILAGTSYAVLGMVGAAISLVPMGLAGWWLATKRCLHRTPVLGWNEGC